MSAAKVRGVRSGVSCDVEVSKKTVSREVPQAGQKTLGHILVREVTRVGGEVTHVKLVVEWIDPHAYTMPHTCEVYDCEPDQIRMAHVED